MRFLRQLQPWLTGRGPRLHVAAFVPATQPRRQWADTCPWPALVAAGDHRVDQRCPGQTARGRPAVAPRVLRAVALLQPELACSEAQSWSRVRTAVAVLY